MLAVSIPKMILNKTTQCGLFWKETEIIYSPGNKYKTQGQLLKFQNATKTTNTSGNFCPPQLRCLSIPNQGCMEHAVDRSHPPVESLRRQWWGQVLLPSTSAIVCGWRLGCFSYPVILRILGFQIAPHLVGKYESLLATIIAPPVVPICFIWEKFGPMLI